MELRFTKSQERKLVALVENWQEERHTQMDQTCASVTELICYSGSVGKLKIVVGPAGLIFFPKSNFSYAIVVERGEERLYFKSRMGSLYSEVRDRFTVQEIAN